MVEELTAQFRVCKHIKRSGDRCNSPAMSGMNFCFHHIGGKVASLVREGATWDASAQLDLDYPADRESIQQNIMLVAHALREGKIDNQTANTYIRIFRLAEQNLHRWEKKQKNSGKTKMPQTADTNDAAITNNDAATTNNDAAATNDVILSEANPNLLSFRAERSEAGVPGTRGVRVLGWEAEEPALPPAPPQQPYTNTDVIPSKREARAKEPVDRPRPNNPRAQYIEDLYYGRIPPLEHPEDLYDILAAL
jgi:hypothetical protein